MLDAVPTHVLAAAGRTRLKERRRDAALTRNLEELEASAESASTAAARSAYLTMVAELYERRLALPTALAKAEAAVAACATYTPALHVHARVLERMGNPDHLEQAIAVLERIAEIANVNQHKALALCQAGTIALRCGRRNEPNPRAWILFARALELAPVWEPAARGLRRTREAHGTEGAPSLQALLQRHLHALQDDEPTTENLRELIRLGGEIDGPGCVIALCESIAHREQLDVELFVDLAQAQAKCDRWDEAVKTLEAALQRDVTPERRAALLFFAGEANERAKRPAAAIPQYLAAAKAGFYPPHALSAAERLAAASGATDDRVEALRLLIDVVDGTDRAQCLHTLAELYRGPIGQPDVAIEFLRELSLLRPTDVDVLLELHRLFGALGRPQEAISTLTTGLVHLRAWLRSSHPYSTSEAHHESEQLDPQPIMGLMRLFEAIGNRDGMYLAACVLEGFAPQSLGASYSPQELGRALWPLPTPHAGWPIDAMLGDLAAARALSVLAHGIPHLMGSPLPSTEPHEPSTTRELPDTHALVGVIRVLAKTLGMAAPQVIAEPMLDQEVIAHGSLGALLVGKRIVSAPNATSTRDAIGRSLFRLRLGGDALWAQASPEDLARVAAGLASLTGVEVDLGVDVATEFVGRLADLMSGPDIHRGLSTAAKALRDVAPSIRPEQIQLDLFAAEDRAGVLCSGDPRPAIARLRSGPLVRRIALLRFLLSDDHLGMRAALGYLGTAKTPPISPPEVRA
jgi:tetratricopeptide (TPR) repeat protein